ncbi:MAG: hypothetical protein ACE5GB_11575 [Acidimicrobiales bacterium]
MRARGSLIALLVIAVGAMAACSSDGSSAEPSAVTFNIEMIEVKGGTDGIPPPDVDPVSLSAGYRFKGPGDFDVENPDKWQVSTCMFAPGAMTVAKGDDVSLRIFGVNGDEHEVWVEAPDGTKVTSTHSMNRGREYNLSFIADQSGHYRLICGTHAPTMEADIFSIS